MKTLHTACTPTEVKQPVAFNFLLRFVLVLLLNISLDEQSPSQSYKSSCLQ